MNDTEQGFTGWIIRKCMQNRLTVLLLALLLILAGIRFAPFDWNTGSFPRNPVPVDAIPDIGENQQIVFTDWRGRSPQDIEDQVTYPLTTALLGLPDVKTVRSTSMFGFSSIYIIFNEQADFYESRSRILEKLSSLPDGLLPDGVQPRLGPDATALGQVFWYTLEGNGWDLHELRSVQDWQVRYALMSVEGVSEVAGIGGTVQEFQVDADPDALRHYGVTLDELSRAVRNSNSEIGARTLEINRVEYFVRGLGFARTLEDIRSAVIRSMDGVPVTVGQVAAVQLGPAPRRGALDKGGAEAVGGVVVVRYGENPLGVIQRVKEKLAEIAPSLPSRTLADGTESRIEIVPFYDRTHLIHETLGTLESALTQQILITVLVVLIMVASLRSAALISGLLPMAVLFCFITMKFFGVDANIVALSGIAIAIGTMVDMGIVLCENILRHLDEAGPDADRPRFILNAATEVGSAVMTAVITTILGFLPVFAMTGAEGKLFKPLAFTKTFALAGSIILALTLLPPLAAILFGNRKKDRASSPNEPLNRNDGSVGDVALPENGGDKGGTSSPNEPLNRNDGSVGDVALPENGGDKGGASSPNEPRKHILRILRCSLIALVVILLAVNWRPIESSALLSLLLVLLLGGAWLAFFHGILKFYHPMLAWCLEHKKTFLALPLTLVLLGALAWANLGREFMPRLDEGSFLYMPSTVPGAGIEAVTDIIRQQDRAIQAIPEVETVVGKLGRVDSPLDPAPLGMIETLITYKPEYGTDPNDRRVRLWRDEIKTDDDIWREILAAGTLPGVTGAEKLQPISTRLVMLQSGIRGSMAVKLKGPTLTSVSDAAAQIEQRLRNSGLHELDPAVVNLDRSAGDWKPYLLIEPDRAALAQYGISIGTLNRTLEAAVGGERAGTILIDRERYAARIRLQREDRDSFEALKRIPVPAAGGAQIPLGQVAALRYEAGPAAIKSEDAALTGYVFFGKREGFAEVDTVEAVRTFLNQQIDAGGLTLPDGVSVSFAGSYENQVRAAATLRIVIPVSLLLIFLVLHLHFRSVSTTALVFSGIAVAWAGGFILIWLYGQPWFLAGTGLRGLFNIHTVNLSIAVWVGFLALFGIASDDGVVMATYLDQNFKKETLDPLVGPASLYSESRCDTDTRSRVREACPTIKEIRALVMEGGERRVRPCLMTTATTVLALLPVLTATGRGADVMGPMAIPVFGGMVIEVITMFIVPVLYSAIQERKLSRS